MTFGPVLVYFTHLKWRQGVNELREGETQVRDGGGRMIPKVKRSENKIIREADGK